MRRSSTSSLFADAREQPRGLGILRLRDGLEDGVALGARGDLELAVEASEGAAPRGLARGRRRAR